MEFDIYEDLGAIHEEAQKEQQVVLDLKAQIEELQQQIKNEENQKLVFENKNKALLENISSLLLTAKAEISRKDKLIAQVRKEKDDISFRRGKKVQKCEKSTQTWIKFRDQDVQTDSNDTQPPRIEKKSMNRGRALSPPNRDKYKRRHDDRSNERNKRKGDYEREEERSKRRRYDKYDEDKKKRCYTPERDNKRRNYSPEWQKRNRRCSPVRWDAPKQRTRSPEKKKILKPDSVSEKSKAREKEKKVERMQTMTQPQADSHYKNIPTCTSKERQMMNALELAPSTILNLKTESTITPQIKSETEIVDRNPTKLQELSTNPNDDDVIQSHEIGSTDKMQDKNKSIEIEDKLSAIFGETDDLPPGAVDDNGKSNDTKELIDYLDLLSPVHDEDVKQRGLETTDDGGEDFKERMNSHRNDSLIVADKVVLEHEEIFNENISKSVEKHEEVIHSPIGGKDTLLLAPENSNFEENSDEVPLESPENVEDKIEESENHALTKDQNIEELQATGKTDTNIPIPSSQNTPETTETVNVQLPNDENYENCDKMEQNSLEDGEILITKSTQPEKMEINEGFMPESVEISFINDEKVDNLFKMEASDTESMEIDNEKLDNEDKVESKDNHEEENVIEADERNVADMENVAPCDQSSNKEPETRKSIVRNLQISRKSSKSIEENVPLNAGMSQEMKEFIPQNLQIKLSESPAEILDVNSISLRDEMNTNTLTIDNLFSNEEDDIESIKKSVEDIISSEQKTPPREDIRKEDVEKDESGKINADKPKKFHQTVESIAKAVESITEILPTDELFSSLSPRHNYSEEELKSKLFDEKFRIQTEESIERIAKAVQSITENNQTINNSIDYSADMANGVNSPPLFDESLGQTDEESETVNKSELSCQESQIQIEESITEHPQEHSNSTEATSFTTTCRSDEHLRKANEDSEIITKPEAGIEIEENDARDIETIPKKQCTSRISDEFPEESVEICLPKVPEISVKSLESPEVNNGTSKDSENLKKKETGAVRSQINEKTTKTMKSTSQNRPRSKKPSESTVENLFSVEKHKKSEENRVKSVKSHSQEATKSHDEPTVDKIVSSIITEGKHSKTKEPSRAGKAKRTNSNKMAETESKRTHLHCQDENREKNEDKTEKSVKSSKATEHHPVSKAKPHLKATKHAPKPEEVDRKHKKFDRKTNEKSGKTSKASETTKDTKKEMLPTKSDIQTKRKGVFPGETKPDKVTDSFKEPTETNHEAHPSIFIIDVNDLTVLSESREGIIASTPIDTNTKPQEKTPQSNEKYKHKRNLATDFETNIPKPSALLEDKLSMTARIESIFGAMTDDDATPVKCHPESKDVLNKSFKESSFEKRKACPTECPQMPKLDETPQKLEATPAPLKTPEVNYLYDKFSDYKIEVTNPNETIVYLTRKKKTKKKKD